MAPSCRVIVSLATLLMLTGRIAAGQAYAIDRGVWLAGGTVRFSRINASSSSGGASTFIVVSPRVGYFARPGVALSASVPFSYFASSQGHSFTYGLAPGVSYYFRRGVHQLYPFLSGAIGLTATRRFTTGVSGPSGKDQNWTWDLSAGAVRLIARNVGVSGELYYAHTRSTNTALPAGTKSRSAYADFGLRFGVAVFVY